MQLWKRTRYGLLESGPGFVVPAAAGGFDFGFNFRSTQGFVTDGANETYVLLTDTYPTTRGGVTFGWEGSTIGIDARDRNSGVDRRLAGMTFDINDNTNTTVFRVDLPSTGAITVHLAMGDGYGSNAQTTYLEVRDTTTAKITFSGLVTGGTQFADANGVAHTNSNWAANETGNVQTFSTNILRVVLSGTVASDSSTIAHLRVHT